MYPKNTKPQEHRLSYDKILKNTLAQSDEMTIRFINGLLGDDIPLDATVEWLDKESTTEKQSAIIADFYPRINGRMYAIEVEQDSSGDMAIRVFKYSIGGAMLHNMTATKAELDITLPQPCVIFLNSTKNTPHSFAWNVEFFDGQKVTLDIPVIRLADMSVREIAERNLLPIGQFYLRTFDKLTKNKIKQFLISAGELLKELKNATENGTVPYYTALDMQETIKKIMDNVIARSAEEVEIDMTTNITETLEWVDYKKVFEELEERSREEGVERERIETAKRLLNMGLSDEQVAQGSNLTIKDIQELKRDICLVSEAAPEYKQA